MESDRAPDDYSDVEVAALAGCAERTARDIRRWCWQFFAGMYAVPSAVQTQEENNMHGGDAAHRLAHEQLQAIGWGMIEDGRPIRDPDALIEAHGALNVLYAIWCARGKQIRNPGRVCDLEAARGTRSPGRLVAGRTAENGPGECSER